MNEATTERGVTRSVLCVVLAAGEGTRMRSSTPKVLHGIAGRSMVGHVLAAVSEAGAGDLAVVIGPDHEDVATEVSRQAVNASIHLQSERLGTAHAVLAARERLEAHKGGVIVLFGDTPLLTEELIVQVAGELSAGTDIAVVGFQADDPDGYGRLIVEDGVLTVIREHKDATDEQRQISLCNSGIMGFGTGLLPALLDAIGNDNVKGEFYLTDAVEIGRRRGLISRAVIADAEQLMGVNDRAQLAEAETGMQARLRRKFMRNGVTMRNPESVLLNYDSVIENDVEIESHVWVGPGVTIQSNSVIKSFSYIEQCFIGKNSEIGPYARIRPGSVFGEKVKVGNFVEIKNSQIADGAKVNHLSYVGDATIGIAANVGAGTITCNYDGHSKHRTTIGGGAFIGSNSSLVAPVTIGEKAYVGSGSVITHNVPAETLAVGRGRQRNIEGWKKLKRS